jgi:hypothetical protein
MRHIFMLPIAAAFVFGPLAFNSDKAEAMIGGRGLERLADALSPIERAGCWRYGWHGWGWYPRCGWGGFGHYGWGHGYYGGGWGWHRGGVASWQAPSVNPQPRLRVTNSWNCARRSHLDAVTPAWNCSQQQGNDSDHVCPVCAVV